MALFQSSAASSLVGGHGVRVDSQRDIRIGVSQTLAHGGDGRSIAEQLAVPGE